MLDLWASRAREKAQRRRQPVGPPTSTTRSAAPMPRCTSGRSSG